MSKETNSTSDETVQKSHISIAHEKALEELGLTKIPVDAKSLAEYDKIVDKHLWQLRADEVGLPHDTPQEKISEVLRKKMAKTLNLPEDTPWEVINSQDNT